jgi:DNA topoisomerase-2
MPYISFLETLSDGSLDKTGKKIAPSIKDFSSTSTEVNVDIVITFTKGRIESFEETIDETTGCNGIDKLLKLTTTISATNMHMFTSQFKLKKYISVEEIIHEFYDIRIDLYQKRKDYLIREMESKLVKLSNRARYIQETLSSTIDLRRKTAIQVDELLSQMQFAKIDGDFKYLVKMPMDSVTDENVIHIMKEKETMDKDLVVLKSTKVETIWLNELHILETEYDKYKSKRERIQSGLGGTDIKKKLAVRPKKT